MVKRSLKDTERFENARECIANQIKEEEIDLCAYSFLENGTCCVQVFESASSSSAKPNEMIDIAVEHFNKFGEVTFEGHGKHGIVRISCFEGDATKTLSDRLVEEKVKKILAQSCKKIKKG